MGTKSRHLGSYGISPQPSTFNFQPSRQRGVALIITLILLGVVTFMAIAFLALSRRERGAVTTVTDTASARLAADAALANAEAQVVANVLSTTNPCNFGLLVSTNYINPNGFNPANNYPFANVNYDHQINGSPLLPDQFLTLLTNLWYSPRPPVFIPNPTNSSLPPDFRYYLDLNRNGRFDTNGWVLETNYSGQAGVNFEVGDPEWIGVLQRPDQPHGPNNPFVARYAFIALPIGNALDLNAIHNQAMTKTVNSDSVTHVSDGYFRNQGVGSWEINLAAFLTDLDPNQWDTSTDPYTYLQPANGNTGRGFEDALSLLSYRYGYNYNSLTNAAALLNGAPGLANGNIDSYSYGPLMTTPAGITVSQNVSLWPWVGADNTNHFFTPEELFNPNESSTLFVNSLLAAGATNNIYENYTFYRLLSQLGTDSTPDSGKMNINYDNIDLTNGVASSTNFMSWQPLAFFTNAADRLLRAYTTEWRNGNPANFANTFYSVSDFSPMFSNPSLWTNYPAFGIGHIPVLVSNRFVYASAVNRLLQLAANMYDATTNRAYLGAATYPYLPTVFQPIFMVTNGNVYITNFIEVTNTSFLATPPSNLGYGPSVVSNLSQYPNSLVFGVPLIIGAKKGLPNFNEFALESAFTLTRKLQATRTTTNAPASSYQLNQMFNLSVNNQLGVECWNSYSNNYTRPVTIMVNDYLVMGLTNDENYSTNTGMTLTNSLIPLPIQPWQGYKDPQFSSAAALSFRTPLNANIAFVPTSTYRYNGGNPYLTTNLNLPFETNGSSYLQPHWGMTLTNLLQVAMVDVNSGRIIDYVQLSGPNSIRDLSAEIQQWCDNPAANNAYLDLWDTNLTNGVPMGVGNQISVSLGINPAINPSYWKDPTSATNEVNGTRAFFHVNELPGSPKSSASYYAAGLNSLSNEIAYTTPPATVVLHVTWQANDPLVHYLAGDLAGGPYNETDITPYWPWPPTIPNDRYRPWGVAGADSQNAYNSALKDPLMWSSDFWDFPANKFPTVGWLGRVHRGTPWQTVYLKASDILAETNPADSSFGINAWTNWTGNANITNATYNAPVQDRLLFDLFTTAFNDNATRGTLSVNVGPTNANLAAWSALFSGIAVPTSLANTYTIISPAGSAGAPVPAGPPPSPNSPLCLGYLVQNGTNGINDIRANTNLFPQQTFEHVGDILAVPALTEKSPFLNWNDPVQQQNGISDEMMEWLPQQVMSLLRCSSSPRYVIYCYGQALKPAPDSILTGGGPYFGMITNYQVVSEIATRAVVRFNSTVTNVITFTNGFNADGVYVTNWFTVPVVTNNNAVIESFNILPPD